MKKILFFCAALAAVFADLPLGRLSGSCETPGDFTPAQKKAILFAFHYGNEQDLGYMMAAIAWQESCAGKYMLNFSDPSAGLFHAHLPVVIAQYSKLKDSAFNRNMVGQILIQDQDFAAKVALDQLLMWRKRFGGNQEKMLKSYNKGTSWLKNQEKNQKAELYAKKVSQKIALLKAFIPIFLIEEEPLEWQEQSKSSDFFLENQNSTLPDKINTQKKKQDFYFLSE
ncbi:hypothetical protein [Helicobacter mustelae]|uniref:Transglycosylase SLT domain-containing protein n=1 Tax=Helicobacter mustelae (strain ATCC 43772 / CCUG 25715 / CIP 103759 / LMG 18044 / NCTC 12198 / R85-136P) TaxID=679897 RepID=D3UHP6_HELM1|nr:hypothetical protein [Helicobacter mustelae]CBG40018.1 Putative hypothetical protein [Helicobacter mustelae 12198]SQH71530.1 Uncharacterised protein [Helicobacter mustelae]STP12655.1 Uncharacterised protein [Helicobacter mustelae]